MTTKSLFSHYAQIFSCIIYILNITYYFTLVKLI
ncbi:hypothetical protein [Staphylococcus phage vB_ScaM-V1SC04]|nr:hypothetical protein [Staphylococcus phage vB_ScaM-V1SC04]